MKSRHSDNNFEISRCQYSLLYAHLDKRKHEHPMKINEFIKRFLECAGLRISDTRKGLCLPAIELALKYQVDFIDAHTDSLCSFTRSKKYTRSAITLINSQYKED